MILTKLKPVGAIHESPALNVCFYHSKTEAQTCRAWPRVPPRSVTFITALTRYIFYPHLWGGGTTQWWVRLITNIAEFLPHPSLALLVPPVSPAGSGTSGSDSPPECHSIPSVSLRYPEGKVVGLCLFCCFVVGIAFRRDARPRPTGCAISNLLSTFQPIIHQRSDFIIHHSLFSVVPTVCASFVALWWVLPFGGTQGPALRFVRHLTIILFYTNKKKSHAFAQLPIYYLIGFVITLNLTLRQPLLQPI